MMRCLQRSCKTPKLMVVLPRVVMDMYDDVPRKGDDYDARCVNRNDLPGRKSVPSGVKSLRLTKEAVSVFVQCECLSSHIPYVWLIWYTQEGEPEQ